MRSESDRLIKLRQLAHAQIKRSQKVYEGCCRMGFCLMYSLLKGGGNITDQLIAVIVFGVLTVVLPYALNKWSDGRAGVR